MAAGAIFGAYWIRRTGLRRAMWPLTLGMNLNIWAYVWLAWAKPNPATTLGFFEIGFLHAYENFARGLGDAVLTVFLIYICKPDFKATHFAIGSALMSIGGNVLGGMSGVIVEQVGYVNLYIFSFVCTVPSMLLMFRLPEHLLDDRGIQRIARRFMNHFVFGTSIEGPFPAEIVYFGMGCFWGAERKFWQTPGVLSTAVGYQGGHKQNPSYKEVCSHKTGHVEVVQVVFDPVAHELWRNVARVLGKSRPNARRAPR